MAGMSRAEVLACAGAPFREAADGNITVLSYSDIREVGLNVYRCEVSIMLRDGVVDSVRYRGAKGVCGAILRACNS